MGEGGACVARGAGGEEALIQAGASPATGGQGPAEGPVGEEVACAARVAKALTRA